MSPTLELNDQLVSAMKAVAESKSMLSSFARKEESHIPERISMRRLDKLDEVLCDVINQIAEMVGSLLADEVVVEAEKRIACHLVDQTNYVSE